MSSNLQQNTYPPENAVDGNDNTWVVSQSEVYAWLSIRVPDDARVGYVWLANLPAPVLVVVVVVALGLPDGVVSPTRKSDLSPE